MGILIDKVEKELSKVFEKVTVDPNEDDTVVKLKVDDSDDSNLSYKESTNPYSTTPAIKVEVEIEEDEDSPDSPYIDNLKESVKNHKVRSR